MSLKKWVLETLERETVEGKRKPICKSLDASIELALDDKGLTQKDGMLFSPEGPCHATIISETKGITSGNLVGGEEIHFVAPFTRNNGDVLIVMKAPKTDTYYLINTEDRNDQVNFATVISTFVSVCAGDTKVTKAMGILKEKLNEEFAESLESRPVKVATKVEEPPKQRSHPEWATW